MQIRHQPGACYELVRYRRRYSDSVSVREMAQLAGTTSEVLMRLVDLDIVAPVRRRGGIALSVAALPVIRRALRLHGQLDVTWEDMPLVLELLDRVEELENQVNALRRPVRRRHRQRCIVIRRETKK